MEVKTALERTQKKSEEKLHSRVNWLLAFTTIPYSGFLSYLMT